MGESNHAIRFRSRMSELRPKLICPPKIGAGGVGNAFWLRKRHNRIMAKAIKSDMDDADVSGVVDAALEIAQRRAESLREIKALLEKGEDQEALQLMRKHLNVADPSKKTREEPE